jgi:hypothetical protein
MIRLVRAAGYIFAFPHQFTVSRQTSLIMLTQALWRGQFGAGDIMPHIEAMPHIDAMPCRAL